MCVCVTRAWGQLAHSDAHLQRPALALAPARPAAVGGGGGGLGPALPGPDTRWTTLAQFIPAFQQVAYLQKAAGPFLPFRLSSPLILPTLD